MLTAVQFLHSATPVAYCMSHGDVHRIVIATTGAGQYQSCVDQVRYSELRLEPRNVV
jgi:hypothetical protein